MCTRLEVFKQSLFVTWRPHWPNHWAQVCEAAPWSLHYGYFKGIFCSWSPWATILSSNLRHFEPKFTNLFSNFGKFDKKSHFWNPKGGRVLTRAPPLCTPVFSGFAKFMSPKSKLWFFSILLRILHLINNFEHILFCWIIFLRIFGPRLHGCVVSPRWPENNKV